MRLFGRIVCGMFLLVGGWLAAGKIAGAEAGSERVSAGSATFFDPAGDDRDHRGPDITEVVVSNDDAGNVRFSVQTDFNFLTSSTRFEIFVDTDRTLSTGNQYGSDFAIVVTGPTHLVGLYSWSAGKFNAVHAHTLSGNFTGGKESISINRSDLANTSGFFFVIESDDAGFGDRAPDSGTWSYTLSLPATSTSTTTHTHPPPTGTTTTHTHTTPPGTTSTATHTHTTTAPTGTTTHHGGTTSTATTASHPHPKTKKAAPHAHPTLGATGLIRRPARPRAGAMFAAGIGVYHLKTRKPIRQGRVTCVARVAGKPLATQRALFVRASAAGYCYWRVPKGTRGDWLSGSISVVSNGALARRTFLQRIR